LRLVRSGRWENKARIRDLEVQMEQLRVFLRSSYKRAGHDASDPMVLEISEQFDTLMNEWMALKYKSGRRGKERMHGPW